MKCPRCGSTNINTYRHLDAKVWCMDCGFVLRDEGSTFYNAVKVNDDLKSHYEHIRVKPRYTDEEVTALRRKIKNMRKHIKNMEKGIHWRGNLIDELEKEIYNYSFDNSDLNYEGYYNE